jgi:hypothetical protein
MILTALRIMDDGSLAPQIICDDTDFNTALELVRILIQHAAKVYESLPAIGAQPIQPDRRQQFFEALPEQFDHKKSMEVAMKLQIPESTADKLLGKLVGARVLSRQKHGKYTKNNP